MNKERYIKKLETIREAGNYRTLRAIEHNGFLIHADGKEMLNLSSNDYLGLSTNPKLLDEFRMETDVLSLPYSAASSRLLSGNHPYYGLLEKDLVELYEKPAALVFNSGYHANIGILPALTTKRDLIIADKLVHASIIDGIRLSEAQMLRYRHLDYEHLHSLLVAHREEYDNVFIVTESVFSMDGDTADLQQLCEIKKEFDAFLYVDEAHAVGVRGTNGLGCCEEQACVEDIDFIVGTFGKALASQGAFVICEQLFRDYLINTQRSLIFTTALPPVNVAWTRFVLNRLPDFYDLRIHLSQISEQLRGLLFKKGFETRGDSHIVPMLCGSNEDSLEMANLFQENGFFALPVRYPTVPKNEARIRFSLNASIPDEDYQCLFELIQCLE
ncbi:8-amino-7-oxononanoate synthase [Bacteroides acidifaciens]|uniref:aminotransferase class I/II-fold pyridoxal phosphate-dependent enzyme n=1 Tax=Bacteroides acidifaciens TaxID=85831 RepID=UPI002558293A|nr:8-amino-7-oxononanoate synthase [Bacteroides acidifaciens]